MTTRVEETNGMPAAPLASAMGRLVLLARAYGWLLVLLPALALAWTWHRLPAAAPRYQACARLFIGDQPTEEKLKSQFAVHPKMAERYFKTQQKLITSGAVIEKAFETLSAVPVKRVPKDAQRFARAVRVAEVKDAQLVDVLVTLGSPEAAAAGANAVADAFVAHVAGMESGSIARALAELRARRQEVFNRARAMELAADAFESATGLRSPEGARRAEVEKLARLGILVAEARAEVMAATARNDENLPAAKARLASLTDSEELAAEALVAFDHAAQDYAKSAEALAEERALLAELTEGLAQSEAFWNALHRDVRVVTRATAPVQALSTGRRARLIRGALFGLAIALMLALAIEQLRCRVRSAGDVSDDLDLPYLGAVPREPNARRRDATQLILKTLPESPAADRLRALAPMVAVAAGESDSRAVAFVSAQCGEGRSTLAANLALALAERGKRVLLIDADLAEPTLHKAFGVTAKAGLTDVLASDVAPADAVCASGVDGLDLLLAGGACAGAGALLAGSAAAAMAAWAAGAYDIVLYDTPAFRAQDGAAAVAVLAGAAVYAARPSRTHRQRARFCADTLRRDGVDVLGAVVLDAVPARFRAPDM